MMVYSLMLNADGVLVEYFYDYQGQYGTSL